MEVCLVSPLAETLRLSCKHRDAMVRPLHHSQAVVEFSSKGVVAYSA